MKNNKFIIENSLDIISKFVEGIKLALTETMNEWNEMDEDKIVFDYSDECIIIKETQDKSDGEVADRYVGIKLIDGSLYAIRLNSNENIYSECGGEFFFEGEESFFFYEDMNYITYEKLFSQVSLDYSLELIKALLPYIYNPLFC